MRLLILLTIILTQQLGCAETLTIGTPPFSPPFVMSVDNKGHYIGFSVDIMSSICKRMGVTCQFKLLGFEETFTQVIDNKVDLAIGNITITPEREEYVLFSLPYLQSNLEFITLANSTINSLNELKGKSVGAEHDSVFIPYIEKNYGRDVRVQSYRSISEMIFALSEGDVDAAILDQQTAQFWQSNNNGMFKFIGEPVPLGLGIGIIANKNNEALIARVNKALTAMQTDGGYLKIYNTYFGDMRQVGSSLF